jgi:hypothetical protein
LPIARNGDPQTSHDAAASVQEVSAAQTRLLALYALLGQMTDTQLVDNYRQMAAGGDWPPMSDSGIRTRRHELVQQGRVVDSGNLGVTPSGRRSILWTYA